MPGEEEGQAPKKELKVPRDIPLAHPIQFGTETIEKLTIAQRPQAKHFRQMPAQNQTMGDMLDLLGRVTGQPKAVIDKLDVEDMLTGVSEVSDFLPDSLATGGSR